jgi:hypothetical protein
LMPEFRNTFPGERNAVSQDPKHASRERKPASK